MDCKKYFYLYYFGNKELIDLYRNKNYEGLLIYLSKEKNSLEEIINLTKKYKFYKYNFDEVIIYASKNNHKELVEYLISKGVTNFNWAMASASFNNHKELVEYFISKGADNFNLAIGYASLNNHKELVEYLKEKKKEYENQN